MKTATATDEATYVGTYVVRIDLSGKPFLRRFVEATSEADALATVQEACEEGEVPADATPLQPILDRIIERRAAGATFSVSFKHEDEDDETFVPYGPVYITDMDALRAEAEKQGAIRADGTIVQEVPFGTTPDYETPLPWMSKADAKRLADYLGVDFGES